MIKFRDEVKEIEIIEPFWEISRETFTKILYVREDWIEALVNLDNLPTEFVLLSEDDAVPTHPGAGKLHPYTALVAGLLDKPQHISFVITNQEFTDLSEGLYLPLIVPSNDIQEFGITADGVHSNIVKRRGFYASGGNIRLWNKTVQRAVFLKVVS